MARVHCLDCETDVVVDPQGICPSGHHVGVSGERVDEAIGSHTPHPDEPVPWVGIIDPAEVAEAPVATAPRTPMPQTAPGLAPAPPPPVDTQGLFAELGALGDDEPSTNGAGHAPAPQGSDAPAPWQASDAPSFAPANGTGQAHEPAPAHDGAQDHEPAPTNGFGAGTGPASVDGWATADEPEPAREPAPATPSPVRSVPAGGPEAREALSEISALEAAVRSLTDEAETPTAGPQAQPQPEERMFAPAPPPPPPASSTPPTAVPTPAGDEQQELRRAAFADVASLGFEPAEPMPDHAAVPDTHAPEPEAAVYEQPQAAGAEGQSTLGLDTMNFTAKGGRMRRSDQRKRRLFGR